MDDLLNTIRPQRLRKTLQRLLDIYSPSGKEEEILQYLHGFLKKQKLPVSRQAVDDNRYNLIVLPPERNIQVVLVGHVDTVTAHDLDEYGFQEEGDLIKGLGAADMKGGCAAMLEAYTTFWESNPAQLPAALCLVVGEEETGDGAKQFLEDFSFPWAIIGEPTDLLPCLSNYGYLEVQVSTLGRRLHASLARSEENPVELMLHLMMRLSRFMKETRPSLVYNIRDLSSSQSGFAVPERCEAWVDIHLPPGAPVGEIATGLEEIFQEEKEKRSGVEVAFRIATIDAGYELPERGMVVENLRKAYAAEALPWKTETFRSHSDANQLWAGGTKTILLGPGSLEAAHATNESVSFQQVCTAARIYLHFLRGLSA